jgi:predicted transcriptional regulator
MTVGDLLARLQPGETPLFMVMRDSEVMGVISAHELSGMAQTPELNDVVIAADVMSPRPPAVYGDDNLYELLNIMHQMNIDVLPVVSHKEEGRYIGFIHQERVTEALNKYLENTQQALIHEHAGLGAIRRDQQVQQLLGTMAPTQQQLVQRLLVPMQAIGLSLRQADLRKQPDGSVQCPPDIDAPLSTKQRLVAIVSK